ncbi:ribose transport system substrate-binding protein [Spinactinospora alkalitolerans]|uniref:Ribose transport system substrate-binding protein n=1 Tax=Spinactinospora alkalitolerans TaxID=687207 RepID=A0A852TUK5_9ACTN|nr:ABC transporter substrate-binding protein [Spinactinospora alkalitolerans]NYE48126.1 ribose transport system substrate-binding protein [Spinactinospora alkalitolerans]
MPNHRRPTKAITMLSIGVLALAGCSEEPMGVGQDAADDGGEVQTVGLMVQDLSNPFFTSMQEGVEEAAEEMGATVITEDGRQDLGAQNAHIDSFVQQQIDVLLINPVDSEGIAPAVQRAVDAGITVVAVDVTAEGAQATITSDNVQAGEQVCTHLFEEMGGEGDILIVDGTPISSIQDRVEGCENVLEDYPDIEVVGHQNGDNNRSEALDIATDMLTASPDVDGIFAVNDPTALGAALAAEQAGLDDLKIVGVDGAPEAEEEMAEEDSMLIATAAQDPELLGVRGLEMAADLRAGEELEEDTILVETTLVTPGDLADYEGWR